MNKMIRLLPMLIAIVLLFLLGIGMKTYFDLTGTPWERANARKQLEAYLQKRFTQKMIIEENGLDFKNPAAGFYYSVQIEGSNFWIRVRQVERYSPNFTDDFYTTVWEMEARKKIQAFLQTVYMAETKTSVDIYQDNFSQLPLWEISYPPSSMDLQANVSEYGLSIWVTPDFDKDHPNIEYETMFYVIQFLKESDLVPGHLYYYFGFPDPTSDKDDEKYIRYTFSQNDFNAITSVQTMIAVLERDEDGSPTREVFR